MPPKILCEDIDNPIVRNAQAKDDFDTFIAKPENAGAPFSKNELSILDTLETVPYKKSTSSIRYSAVEETNNKNKELMVVKKKNRYVAYFCIKKPVDISTDSEVVDSAEDIENAEKEAKDDIIIKISRPFEDNKSEDVSLLANFVTFITNEYHI